jgi:hypothetical protein
MRQDEAVEAEISDEEKAWVMDAASRNGLILVMQRKSGLMRN